MDTEEKRLTINLQKDTVEGVTKKVKEATGKESLELDVCSLIGNIGKARTIFSILSDYLAHNFKGEELR